MIDLVLCKHKSGADKLYLFQAPPNSNFRRHEMVNVETEVGEKTAIVVESCTIDPLSREFELILTACGAYLPLKKVISRMIDAAIKPPITDDVDVIPDVPVPTRLEE